MLVRDPDNIEGNMGRKKKNKRQSTSKDGEDDDIEVDDAEAKSCPHLAKATNPHSIRKSHKQDGIYAVCTTCLKEDQCQKDGTQKDGPPKDNEGEGASGGEEEVTVEQNIWMCLQCGFKGCGRYSAEQHAIKHYNQPRSTCHAVALSLTHGDVWCYECNEFVDPEHSPKLVECVDFVQRNIKNGVPENIPASKQEKATTSSGAEVETRGGRGQARAGSAKHSGPVIADGGSPVKGLFNLGNTCFFNSVCQALCHTGELEALLQEACKRTGREMTLPGRPARPDLSSDDSSDSDTTRTANLHVEPLTVHIGEVGTLTSSFKSFLTGMHDPGTKATFDPASFFSRLTGKVPRFKGFQQHDAHELLRSLLDSVKAEEHHRRKAAILKQLNVTSTNVDEDTKYKVKAYGKQADHTVIDSLFGGQLVSIVQCHDCGYASYTFEAFLDLSLPIPEDKHGGKRGGKSVRFQQEDSSDDELLAASRRMGPSKHQTKKAKKDARRAAKRGRQAPKRGGSEGEEKREEGEEQEEEGHTEDPADETLEFSSSAPADAQTTAADEEKEAGSADPSDLIAPLAEMSLNGDPDATQQYGEEPEDEEEGAADATLAYTSNGVVEGLPEEGVEVGGAEGADEDASARAPSPAEDALNLIKARSGSVASMNSLGSDPDSDLKHSDGNDSGDSLGNKAAGVCSSNGGPAPSVPTSLTRQQIQKAVAKYGLKTLGARPVTRPNETSVQTCLAFFTSPELLTANNKYGCRACTRRRSKGSGKGSGKVMTDATKQYLIFSPPAVLTVHIKRFAQSAMGTCKVNKHVDFPGLLDLAPYCSALCQKVPHGQRQVLYWVYGVVSHSGTMRGGHYIAFVRARAPSGEARKQFLSSTSHLWTADTQARINAWIRAERAEGEEDGEEGKTEEWRRRESEGRWFRISDSSVVEVRDSQVLAAQAYLLFYERVY